MNSNASQSLSSTLRSETTAFKVVNRRLIALHLISFTAIQRLKCRQFLLRLRRLAKPTTAAKIERIQKMRDSIGRKEAIQKIVSSFASNAAGAIFVRVLHFWST